MKITCISDLHGHYPELSGGDLLIIAGDLTATDEAYQYIQFSCWISRQPYKRCIFIGGNHDNLLQDGVWPEKDLDKITYLEDSGTEFEGLKIWGCPWTLKFPNQNPSAMAFTCDTERQLLPFWELIPDDTDILITHTPSKDVLDRCSSGVRCGSWTLQNELWRIRPKLHVFGHIHEGYGSYRPNLEFLNCEGYPISVNAAHMNVCYKPINAPIDVEL